MTQSFPLVLPWPLAEQHRAISVALLCRYFKPKPTGEFTGAYFERLGGGGDRPSAAFEFTAEDIVAVMMLSVDVPGTAALRILGADRAHLSELLRGIPTDVDLVDVEADSIGPGWPPWQLEAALKSMSGLGPTTVSKLIARKRPRLVPVFDAIVAKELDLTSRPFWTSLSAALRANEKSLHLHLLSLRDDSGIGGDISPLRVFDVVTWMTGQGYADKMLSGPIRSLQSGADI